MARIALVAPPLLPIPPTRYAGTERVVAALGAGLHRRGHEVTLFGPGDSDVPYQLVPTVAHAAWSRGFRDDPAPLLSRTVEVARDHLAQFDIVHTHIEEWGLHLADSTSTPVVATFHGRLDSPLVSHAIERYPAASLVSISASQRRWHPDAHWVATIHHGLPFADVPARGRAPSGLVLVGRATAEKGIEEAIAVARATGQMLTIAAKAHDPAEHVYVDDIIRPAVATGCTRFLGEVAGPERDALLASATATLMLGGWPEPFGLVAIESLAVGTPVIARRAGALPEIIEHGVDGFLVDDLREAAFAVDKVAGLDREGILVRARARFGVDRMVDAYEAAYGDVLAGSARLPAGGPHGTRFLRCELRGRAGALEPIGRP